MTKGTAKDSGAAEKNAGKKVEKVLTRKGSVMISGTRIVKGMKVKFSSETWGSLSKGIKALFDDATEPDEV